MPQNTSAPLIKAAGLVVSPNQLDTAEGSLSLANNIVIRRDNVVEPRRGYTQYGEAFGGGIDRAKQLMEYQNRLIRHYSNVLSYDTDTTDIDGLNIFADFAGTFLEPQSGLRIKSIEANKNLYFTSSQGIQKISAASANDFSTSAGFITKAGGLKALDITSQLNIQYGESTGFLPDNSAVAYRVVWGQKDANGNLILGTPSSRSQIYNLGSTMNIRDFMALLYALDQLNTYGSNYTDANYVDSLGLSANATATELYNNLISLVAKMDAERGTLFSSGQISSASITSGVCTVVLNTHTAAFGKVQSGDQIYLSGFSPSSLNGLQTVVAVTDDGTHSNITFNTSVTGSVTTSSASITSGTFRGITQPATPTVPSTAQDDTNLQNWMQDIITKLQSTSNQVEVAKHVGISTQNPLEISTVSVATNQLTINFDTSATNSDARNQFIVNDYIYLSGTWTAGSQSLVGVAQINTVNSGSIVATLTFTPATPGSVTIGSDSLIYRILWYSNSVQSTYISNLAVTLTATVINTILVPNGATLNHFFQIYRSPVLQASGTDIISDLIPSDELKLVYEAFPTQAQLDARLIVVEDITPDSFINGATPLYTNQISGEGILQANDVPPLALDINTFKNYTWYANTTSKQQLQLNLLGVQSIIDDYNNGLHPSLTIASSSAVNTYRFIEGVQEITQIICNAGSTLNASGTASYFLLNGGDNLRQYYFWYSIGTATDPAISGRTGVQIYATASDSNTTIASKTTDRINTIVDDFSATLSGHTITITNIIEGPTTDASAGTSGFNVSVTQQGDGENISQEITSINAIAGNLYVTSGTADYFTLNTPFDRQLYAFWFDVSGGTMTAPSLPGRTIIAVPVTSSNTAPQVAAAIAGVLPSTLTSSVNSNVVTVTTIDSGPTTDATKSVSNPGFTISVTQQGAMNVLLSNLTSPSLAVEATSLSLTNIMNRNIGEPVSAFYLSGPSDTPGEILFEDETLGDPTFYVIGNTENIGNSFSPNIAQQTFSITNTAANPTVVTANNHGLQNGDQVIISNSNSFPIIDGVYTISNVTTNTFTIPVRVLTPGTTGTMVPAVDSQFSDNQIKPNRVYYSKLQQPEAVPIVNYLDVGSANKAILRIFPLRDSLFVFKEDGLFRISGETVPFTLTLFDATAKLVAPDSLGSLNNIIYGWLKQGISTISESGVKLVSRPIDTLTLPLSTTVYPGFTNATFGIGYESDNAYYVFTVSDPIDTEATICYRFSNLTNTWTTYDKSNTCGIIKLLEDKMFLGDGVSDQLEVERKNFDRTDYADKEYNRSMAITGYTNNGINIKLNTVSQASVGDSLLQEQTLSIYTFNQLLKKLDNDVNGHDKNYFSTLQALPGGDLRTSIVNLANKLDADTGFTPSPQFAALIVDQADYPIISNSANSPTVINSTNHGLQTGRIIDIAGVSGSEPSIIGQFTVTRIDNNHFSIPVNVLTAGTGGTFTTEVNDFTDIQVCYNLIINALNTNSTSAFKNYQFSTGTTNFEVIITNVNVRTGVLTVNLQMPFVVGPMTLFKAIKSEFTYSPLTFGDPINFKQLREATIMFQDKTFTSAIMSFATDLLPEFQDIMFNGYGNGLFGNDLFGQNYFGGNSHSAPFRTYIPRQCQRCRYLNVKITHEIAREKFSIYGISLTGRFGLSPRAYRE